jgi:hypothetical protein
MSHHLITDRRAPSRWSRREFLESMGWGAVGLLVPGLALPTPSQAVAAAAPGGPARPFRLAMHVHASFSEGWASMYASLAEAARTGLDLVFFTDHDWRKQHLMARRVVHFTSLEEKEDGLAWIWRPRREGAPAAVGGGIVANPVSPNDAGTPGALSVKATAPVGATAAYLFDADDTAGERKGLRLNVVGQRIQIDVHPVHIGPDAWLVVRLALSYYPAIGGRPAGVRYLEYRLGTRAGDEVAGLTAIVWRPVPANVWTTVELRPLDDIERVFRDLPVPGDNSTQTVSLGAGARNGATADGHFDLLRFRRDVGGQAAYDELDRLLAPYRGIFPRVTTRHADELGFQPEHLNWLTSHPFPLDYRVWAPDGLINRNPPDWWGPYVRSTIHAHGGLVQLNHPFGADKGNPGAVNQAALLHRQALRLLGAAGSGLDLLEVGYHTRGSASLATHLALYDVLARNGRFLTATGVTDDHHGSAGSWSAMTNRFATGVWAASLSDQDLHRAFLAGRAWCYEVGSWNGTLDLHVDANPMGSVSARSGPAARTVEVACPAPPPGGLVTLLRGVVDHAGTGDPTPRVATIATVAADELGRGPARRGLDASGPCYVRAVVHDRAGRVVGFSNPVWLLRAPPPGGVSAERVAPDSGPLPSPVPIATPPPTGSLNSFGRFATSPAPTRLVDSRVRLGWPIVGPARAGAPVSVPVAGAAGIPGHASAVAMNVTVTQPTAPAFVTVYPSGTPQPVASNLNVGAGQTAANMVLARLGAGGRVDVAVSAGSAHVIIDVVGWFGSRATTTATSPLAVQVPARVLDTRNPALAQGQRRVGPGQSIEVQVVPPHRGIAAVVANLTGIAPSAATFVTAYPAHRARPTASCLNLVAQEVRANLAVVAVSREGRVRLYNAAGWVHLALDVFAMFPLEVVGEAVTGRVVPLDRPVRLVDTRASGGPLRGPGSRTHQVPAFAVGVPGRISGVVVNLTATAASAQTHLTLYAPDRPRPPTSNVNVVPGRTVPNLAVVRLDGERRLAVFNPIGQVHYLVDVAAVVLG